MAFAETDLKLLSALGEQASIALERALLYSYMRDSEARFRLLAENMSDLICLHGVDGRALRQPLEPVSAGACP